MCYYLNSSSVNLKWSLYSSSFIDKYYYFMGELSSSNSSKTDLSWKYAANSISYSKKNNYDN